MLGNDCKEILKREFQVIAPTHKELDITKWDPIIENIYSISPDIIINCAAYTDVDACESEPLLVRKVNVEGPRNLAQGAARFNCKFIHVSSDYVFSGQKNIPQPYFEDDPPDPVSAYGLSKMESETAVRENSPDYIIVRTGWLYGISGKNFITSILGNTLGGKRKTLRVVNDQLGSPTWTYRLALQIKELIKAKVVGTFHATSEGYCSPYDWAQYVFEKLELMISLKPCVLSEFPRPARRPLNCILENRLLKKQGINIMPDWKEDLGTFLYQHGRELIKQAKEKGAL